MMVRAQLGPPAPGAPAQLPGAATFLHLPWA